MEKTISILGKDSKYSTIGTVYKTSDDSIVAVPVDVLDSLLKGGNLDMEKLVEMNSELEQLLVQDEKQTKDLIEKIWGTHSTYRDSEQTKDLIEKIDEDIESLYRNSEQMTDLAVELGEGILSVCEDDERTNKLRQIVSELRSKQKI